MVIRTGKVRRYLSDWADLAKSFDIATGYFEIGALLISTASGRSWTRFRILMGDEVSQRTKKALLFGIGANQAKARFEHREREKERYHFSHRSPWHRGRASDGQITCRVYTKRYSSTPSPCPREAGGCRLSRLSSDSGTTRSSHFTRCFNVWNLIHRSDLSAPIDFLSIGPSSTASETAKYPSASCEFLVLRSRFA